MPDVSLGLAGSFSHGRVITELLELPDPDVATGYIYTVDGSYWERPVALTFQYTPGSPITGALAALQVLDGSGAPVANVPTPTIASLSTDTPYTFLPGVSVASASNGVGVLAQLPPLFMQPTWSLQFLILNGDPGDQLTLGRYYRERFITGPGGYEIGVQQDVTDPNEELLRKLTDLLS